MASLDYYALKDDIHDVINFVLGETDCRIFESYSEFDSELREFRTFEELSAAFELGADPQGQGYAILLKLWSPQVMREMEIERISLKVPGHSFRYAVRGVGLIQLYFGGLHNGAITQSYYGHWTKKSAMERAVGDVATVDWTVLSKLSGRIQRHFRKLAVAKVRARPVLPAAFKAVQNGFVLNYATLRFDAASPEIKTLVT
jgi:hypothetical protein